MFVLFEARKTFCFFMKASHRLIPSDRTARGSGATTDPSIAYFNAPLAEQIRFCRVNCTNIEDASVCAAPRTWANVSCQRLELIGTRHLIATLDHELACANYVREFDASRDSSG